MELKSPFLLRMRDDSYASPPAFLRDGKAEYMESSSGAPEGITNGRVTENLLARNSDK